MARQQKFKFFHTLSLNTQKYLPLDNSVLTHLTYMDPFLINSDKTENAFKKLCDKMPEYIKPEEKEEIISELRVLQFNNSDFGEKFKDYCNQRKDDTVPFADLERIDTLWAEVFKNKKYQLLSKFMKACLSGAEGSI